MKTECPECLKKVDKSELEMFGGLCEECNLEMKYKTMKFKVLRSSETGSKISLVEKKSKEANKAVRELSKEIGFDRWRGGYWCAFGGVSCVMFKNNHPNPKLWKKQEDGFFPKKNSKDGKELAEKFENLPSVGYDELNKTVSTNAYILISTPLQEGFEDLSNKTKGVYPMDFNLDTKILVSELRQKLNDFPKVECYDEEEKECDACDGSGEVSFLFSHDFEDYETEEECPVCEGCGVIKKTSKIPNGKKELDYNKFFGIGNSVFNVARIEELLEVAEALQSEHITLVNQTQPNKASLFKIKEVEVLLMPTMCNDLTNVVQNVA